VISQLIFVIFRQMLHLLLCRSIEPNQRHMNGLKLKTNNTDFILSGQKVMWDMFTNDIYRPSVNLSHLNIFIWNHRVKLKWTMFWLYLKASSTFVVGGSDDGDVCFVLDRKMGEKFFISVLAHIKNEKLKPVTWRDSETYCADFSVFCLSSSCVPLSSSCVPLSSSCVPYVASFSG
jgi:hypothetical protein